MVIGGVIIGLGFFWYDFIRRPKERILGGEPRSDFPYIDWIDGEDVGVKMASTYTRVMTLELANKLCNK